MIGMAIWDFSGRLANYFVLFVVSVVLTRLLSPAEFGAFAVVVALISFSSIFIDLGFRSAIVQHQETTQLQLSTVFFLNFGIGIVVALVMVLGSTVVSDFFGIPGLGVYIISASLIFVLNAAALVPAALLHRSLRIKELSVVNTAAAAISGVVAVSMAFSGAGIWSLIVQQLVLATSTLIGVFWFSAWRPSGSVSLLAIRPLWSYGVRMFAAGFLDTVFTRLDVFMIGKLFPVATLGFYNRSQSLDSLVKTFSASTTASLAFPIIAKMADDIGSIRTFYLRCLNIISFLAFFLIGVLFLTAFDIVIILFTENWTEVGYYFRIMALTGFVYPISALMVNLIAARGNSAAFLKLELLKKFVLFPAYISFFFGGVMSFLVVLGLLYLVALGLNAEFTRREIDVSVGTQFWTIIRYGLVAGVAGLAAYGAGYYVENVYFHFLVAGGAFVSIYLAICYLLKLSGTLEITDQLRNLRNA